MQEIDLDNVTGRVWNQYEGLDSEDAIAGYLLEAQTEGAAGVIDAVSDVVIARFIHQTATATGIDKRLLCEAFDGSSVLDEDAIAKVLQFAGFVGAPLAVG